MDLLGLNRAPAILGGVTLLFNPLANHPAPQFLPQTDHGQGVLYQEFTRAGAALEWSGKCSVRNPGSRAANRLSEKLA